MKRARLLGIALLAITLFGLGLGVGWLLGVRHGVESGAPRGAGTAPGGEVVRERVVDDAAPAATPGAVAQGIEGEVRLLLEGGQWAEARRRLEEHMGRYRATVAQWLLLAEAARGERDYHGEVEALYQARLLAVEPGEEERIARQLAAAIDDHSRELVARHRWGDLDLFYEELITREPENGAHYLQLAVLRIRLGRLAEAEDPLLRIEHDPAYGARARELLDRIERDRLAVARIDLEIPLESRDSHYLVRAVVDGRREVMLIIDTGAAVTVMRPELLSALGYDLVSGERQYFATANGVVAAPIVDVGGLALGSAEIGDLPVAALSLPVSDEVDGLLGMNYLARYEFAIDQERRVLRLKGGAGAD